MNIVIAGGTGFLGQGLAAACRADGHDVVVLTRRPRHPGEAAWNPSAPDGDCVASVDGADAVVNLAGDPLDAGRWTDARKASILASRVLATRALVGAMAASRRRPGVLVSASAIGVYGAHADERLTEDAPAGSDFLASVCTAWEAEANHARPFTRVVLLRTGLVLDRDRGALAQLARPFRLGVGGPAGSGRQYWSWIHRDDWTRLAAWTIATPEVEGPVNLTAPTPVTNADFARALGRALHRPALLPTPGFALRLLLGEMADALILSGQRVLPAKAAAGGFQFRYADVASALDAVYRT